VSEWDVPGCLPGYDLQELLGFGSTGEVWRAREKSSRSLVVLRRLTGADRALVAQVRTDCAAVRSFPSPHLIRLRTTLRSDGDEVLVLEHAAGGSLASLLARRGRLEPGEIVTAVAPVAQVLAHAHTRGLVHGSVRTSEVLLTADGMPLLDGLGLSRFRESEVQPGPADDVHALGALAHLLLTGGAPEVVPLPALAPTAPLPLVEAIMAALDADPSSRPTASALAQALLVACPALPLQGLPASEPTADLPRTPPRAAVRRRTALGAGVSLTLAAVVAVGWMWGGHGGAAVTPTTALPPATAPAGTDWADVLGHLDAGRATAFAHADPDALDKVYARSSSLLAADRQVLAGLASSRRTAVGLVHTRRSVTVLSVRPDRAVLRVEESLAGYELRDGAGITRIAPGPQVRHVIVLVLTASGWRVADVSPG